MSEKKKNKKILNDYQVESRFFNNFCQSKLAWFFLACYLIMLISYIEYCIPMTFPSVVPISRISLKKLDDYFYYRFISSENVEIELFTEDFQNFISKGFVEEYIVGENGVIDSRDMTSEVCSYIRDIEGNEVIFSESLLEENQLNF